MEQKVKSGVVLDPVSFELNNREKNVWPQDNGLNRRAI